MRVSLSACAVVASIVLSLVGCSSMSMSPIWQKLSFRGKKSAPASSSVANAPAAPSFNTTAAPAAPSVSMGGVAQASGNLPVYPGTTYPVTPYPAAAVPNATAANQPAYPTNQYAGDPNLPQQGAVTPQVAGYTPGSTQPAPYTPTQYPPYTPPAGQYNASSPPDTYTR